MGLKVFGGKNLYSVKGIDRAGNTYEVGTDAYSVAAAERTCRKTFQHIIKTELLMEGE